MILLQKVKTKLGNNNIEANGGVLALPKHAENTTKKISLVRGKYVFPKQLVQLFFFIIFFSGFFIFHFFPPPSI